VLPPREADHAPVEHPPLARAPLAHAPLAHAWAVFISICVTFTAHTPSMAWGRDTCTAYVTIE
jgi:hypothetical protein